MVKQKNETETFVFVHIPKCGGSYITNLLSANQLGYSIRFRTVNQINFQQIKNINATVFSAIRNPFTWYISLYQYWNDQILIGSEKFNPIINLARLSFDEFLNIMICKERFKEYFRINSINWDNLEMPDSIPDLIIGIKRFYNYQFCQHDIGFYSYLVLEYLFNKEKCTKLNIERIINNQNKLKLIKHVLHQENLLIELKVLLGSKLINADELIGETLTINKSENRLIKLTDRQYDILINKDRIIFETFGYNKSFKLEYSNSYPSGVVDLPINKTV